MSYSFRNSGVKIQNLLFFKLLIVEQKVSATTNLRCPTTGAVTLVILYCKAHFEAKKKFRSKNK